MAWRRRLWFAALLAPLAASLPLARLLSRSQPPPQAQALALLFCGTVALSLYLLTAIVSPESFE